MASGRVHTMTTVAATVGGAALLAAWSAGEADVFPWFVGGAVAVFVQPDLDHASGYIGLAILRRMPVIGRVLAAVWRLYWMPYRWAVGMGTRRRPGAGDSHRSWLSHLPIVGTALRLAWLLWPFWAIWGVFIPPPEFLAALVLCDFLHVVLDGVQW